eukprot:5912570-Lingulodinium_polyedra.AAC.1
MPFSFFCPALWEEPWRPSKRSCLGSARRQSCPGNITGQFQKKEVLGENPAAAGEATAEEVAAAGAAPAGRAAAGEVAAAGAAPAGKGNAADKAASPARSSNSEGATEKELEHALLAVAEAFGGQENENEVPGPPDGDGCPDVAF